MNKKITLLTVLVLQNLYMQAMDLEKLPHKKEEKVMAFLPLNGIKMVVPQKYDGGKAVRTKEVFGEQVDLSRKDSIQHKSFAQLMKDKIKAGFPYIFAALLMKNKDGKYVRHYQDAGGLVPVLFNEKDMSRTLNKQVTGQCIEYPVHFFIRYPKEENFEYLGSEEDAKNLNVRSVLLVNTDQEMPGDILNYAGVFFEKSIKTIPTGYTFDLTCDNIAVNRDEHQYELYKKAASIRMNIAKKYYKKGAELENLHAMFNLGSIYIRENKDAKAEKLLLEVVKHKSKHVSSAFALLAQLNKKQKKYVSAAENYLKAIEIDCKKRGELRIELEVGLINLVEDLSNQIKELSESQKLSNKPE